MALIYNQAWNIKNYKYAFDVSTRTTAATTRSSSTATSAYGHFSFRFF